MDQWLSEYGPERIILGADVKEGMVAISGWQTISTLSLSGFLANYAARGIRYVVCTDISRDGMLQGTSLDLYRSLRNDFPELKFVASGGITSIAELPHLEEIGMDGAIIGKAIYEGTISLNELKAFIN
jgi:phosphoribosylformimino-5-aminoimidazole carboxamide ribotide isomerase